MYLFHRSNTDIKEISLMMCRPFKDFGKGFYLTEIKDQAQKMAKRVARIYGGTPLINVYELTDSFRKHSDLRIRDF